MSTNTPLYQQYPLHITNTLTATKQLFTPIKPPFVGLYVCGPTVYSDVHLGNVSTFTKFDFIYRYLVFLGYKVRYVRNITDVGHLVGDIDEGEDKIAKKARLEQLEPMEVVQRYTNGFHNVMKQFNNIEPSIEPTATGHILEQIEWVQKIIDNGFAYEVNGSVYFDVPKYDAAHPYGELSGRKIDELRNATRELDGQSDKRSPLDFAIWKKAEPQHIMRWNSPWGEGFPGWHLECSVMSTKYLGETFDIHGGGMDLKFPHHESEIAQAVACCGSAPVNYWMHTNMLTVNGTKMSKSLNNSFLPHELFAGDHELLEKGYSPMTVRFFFALSHYSSQVDFSNEALQGAEKGYKRLMNAQEALASLSHKQGALNEILEAEIQQHCKDVLSHLSDDFNTPRAIASLFSLCTKINDFKAGNADVGGISNSTFEQLQFTFNGVINDVLGLQSEAQQSNHLDDVMALVIELRKQARADKNWAMSDQIRDQLTAAGIQLKDEKGGLTTYSLD